MTSSKGAAGDSLRSPLRTWRRYAAPADDGMWSRMIRPGEKGYGLVPWVMNGGLFSCMGGKWCTEMHPLFDAIHDDDPYYAPAFVTWESPLTTTESARPDVADTFSVGLEDYIVDEVTMPMVLVTRYVYADKESPATLWNQGSVGAIWSTDENGVPVWKQSILAPAWLVTPIDGQYWHPWAKESSAYWAQDMPWLGRLSDIKNDHHSPECYGVTGEEAEDFDDDDERDLVECVCGTDEMNHLFIEQLDTMPLDGGITTAPQTWNELYNFAYDRWREGWKLCHQHAVDQDEVSTDVGYWNSPFWVPDSKALTGMARKEFVDSQPSFNLANAIPPEERTLTEQELQEADWAARTALRLSIEGVGLEEFIKSQPESSAEAIRFMLGFAEAMKYG